MNWVTYRSLFPSKYFVGTEIQKEGLQSGGHKTILQWLVRMCISIFHTKAMILKIISNLLPKIWYFYWRSIPEGRGNVNFNINTTVPKRNYQRRRLTSAFEEFQKFAVQIFQIVYCPYVPYGACTVTCLYTDQGQSWSLLSVIPYDTTNSWKNLTIQRMGFVYCKYQSNQALQSCQFR